MVNLRINVAGKVLRNAQLVGQILSYKIILVLSCVQQMN